MAAELLADLSRATDSNGAPLSGATWTFYESGTSTPQAVYADADLNTSLGSVVTADSAGRFVPIYFDSTLRYRGVLANALGVTLPGGDIDPVNTGTIGNVQAALNAITGQDGRPIFYTTTYDDDLPATITAALAATTGGFVVQLGVGAYDSPFQNASLPTTLPTDYLSRAGVEIRGCGRPKLVRGDGVTTFDYLDETTGSVIRGSFFVKAGFFTIRDCGIDSGEKFCNDNKSSVPQEGLIFHDQYQLNATPEPDFWRDIKVINITILGMGTNSDVHNCLLENVDGFYMANCYHYKGGTGLVIKSRNGMVIGPRCSGSSKQSILLKSEDFGNASGNAIGNRIVDPLAIQWATASDTGGIECEASTADVAGNTITGARFEQVKDGFTLRGSASGTYRAVGNRMDGRANGIIGYPLWTTNNGQDNEVHVIGNGNGSGVLVQSGMVRTIVSGHQSATPVSVNGYLWDFAAANCVLKTASGDANGFTTAHVRAQAGIALYVQGDYTATGTSTTLATGAGAVVGLGISNAATLSGVLDVNANNAVGILLSGVAPSEALHVGAAIRTDTVYKVGTNQVVGARGAAVADATNAAGVPTQAEFNALVTQFNAWLARARAHGLIAP